MRTRMAMLGLVLVVAVAACGGGDDDDAAKGDSVIKPTFEPTTSTTSASGSSTTAGESPASVTAGPTPDPTVAFATTQGSIADASGDTTPSAFGPPPAWTDLVGATLTRAEGGFELRVRLGGGDAPEGSGSSTQTMNVASFYDVDGDGELDFEVWANLADGGWDASYFDDRSGGAAYSDKSLVTVMTEGEEVVLRFPRAHLDDAATFQWSLASEYGPYEAIGTPAMVRDSAPDDGAAVFPDA